MGSSITLFRSSFLNQYLGTFCCMLILVSVGASVGWNSPSILELTSNQSHLDTGPITHDEMSWIASLMSPGGLVGNQLFGYLLNRYGSKIAINASAVLLTVTWILKIIARNPYYYYAAKFLAGVSGGGAFVMIPTFIAEFSDSKIRGRLSSTSMLSSNIGTILAFTVGSFYSSKVTPLIYLPISVIFLVWFPRFFESPSYYAKRGDFKRAEQSILFYNRNISSEKLTTELQYLKEVALKNSKDEKLSISDFFEARARKAMFLSLITCSMQQLCGGFVLLNYASKIFAASDVSFLSPNISSIIIAIIQLLGSYTTTVLVERTGRRIMYIISGVGSFLGLFIFGVYFYFENIGADLTAFSLVPLITFSFTIFIQNCGLNTLPFVTVSEILPPKIKTFGTALAYSLLNLIAFTLLKTFPITVEVFGIHVIFFGFAIFSILGTLVIYLRLPETKGKSLEEIQQQL